MSNEPTEKVKRHGLPRKPLPSKEYLNTCLIYEPDTGRLVWKYRPLTHFKNSKSFSIWNSRMPGKEAGGCYAYKSGPKKGLKFPMILRIDGVQRLASHITFAMLGIEVVDGMEIDHKDRNVWNNRFDNLRLASIPQNSANRVYNRKTNLPKGVFFEGKGRFSSQIGFHGKKYWLGTFDTPEEAHEVYKKRAIELYGEFVCLHSRVVDTLESTTPKNDQ